MTTTSSYDSAIFIQELRKRARFKRVSRAQVVEAFWISTWDLKLAIEQQKPENWSAAQAELIETIIPVLTLTIERDTDLRVDQ